ncbi:FecR family protein [uncultured Chitinophaga sp.]|uniref:FecR family protein n=1 Tax=uncultured Chitinophaga sp. TaxID=339340 RepID=UPI0025CCBF9E|nr:FecR family protein [uncultured Chitinophaga sp.]
MDKSTHISQLLKQVLDGSATADVLAELQLYLREDEEGAYTAQINAVLNDLPDHLPAANQGELNHVVEAVLAVEKQPVKVKRMRFYWPAAAAVLLLAATGTFFLLRPAKPLTELAQQTVVNDALPGSSKATLTLDDGAVITLDSAGNQVLVKGAVNIRQQGGKLSYDVQDGAATVGYNTLRTPRGGQFQLTLPDGTGVWLNAASSIRFPTVFNGNERKVEVTGEAYFEVAKNAAMPFRVKVDELNTVEVLGTSFNINAYEDEQSIKTTLVFGAVRVWNGQQSAILKPGEQAQAANGIRTTNSVNVNKVVAWKNGVFDFSHAELKEVMRQLSRWYDIEVEYQGTAPTTEFWGKMGRNLSLLQVLKGLEGAGVKFRIENNGKKLVVLP